MRRQEVIVPLVIVGVMGPGEGATARDREDAYQLGRAIARKGGRSLLADATKA